jgi:hypothetical protein
LPGASDQTENQQFRDSAILLPAQLFESNATSSSRAQEFATKAPEFSILGGTISRAGPAALNPDTTEYDFGFRKGGRAMPLPAIAQGMGLHLVGRVQMIRKRHAH